jgi:hypothetical protein
MMRVYTLFGSLTLVLAGTCACAQELVGNVVWSQESTPAAANAAGSAGTVVLVAAQEKAQDKTPPAAKSLEVKPAGQETKPLPPLPGTQEKAQEKTQPSTKSPQVKPAEPKMPAPAPETTPAPAQAPLPLTHRFRPPTLPNYPPAAPAFVDPRTGAWRQLVIPPPPEEETESGVASVQCHPHKKKLCRCVLDFLF